MRNSTPGANPTTPLRLAIIGADGMLGTDLLKLANATAHLSVAPLTIKDLNIADAKTFGPLRNLKPQVIVNCAAFTNVDGCETQQAEAFAVNAEGTKNLALFAKEHAAHLVHFSTDYVFDGAKTTPYVENDPTGPLNVYGKSKLAGEDFLREINPSFCILRTQWLYGKHGKNFVETILKLAGEKDRLQVVNDQIGSPTHTIDLAQWTIAAVEKKITGIYHAANSGYCSWFDFAKMALQLRGIATPVDPVPTSQFPRPATRPKNSRLNTEKLARAIGMPLRSWQSALEDYLKK